MAWCLGACTRRWRANLCTGCDGIILTGIFILTHSRRSEDPGNARVS